ncbi:ALDH-like protein [Aspergillus homomorphus CBS 101889]|uniref:aldehyde dehydrogenase (NAD(+)) n=1 Tax=Aspergillus homomorphus (strain CBS 101889) TaxID=1450537 RepID=A0A395HG77_ASPHC|nr:ALDH-like protein [Aspergillus homomorphus CBS 101889]RAL06931.1 ALDH-like protein [Aspergillus homomorphus CBS 101889]
MILKPAEQTPLSALFLAKLIKQAGFPPGVVNIHHGYGSEVGAAIASHKGIDKIAFTGGTGTGTGVMKHAAGTLKNITLVTGGKSPLIIFDDADLDQAVAWAHLGIMSNQGQVCTATSRVFVLEAIDTHSLEKYCRHVQQNTIIESPFSEGVTHGPQVSKLQQERILSYIEAGNKEGATLLLGYSQTFHTPEKGYFVPPTVFTNFTDSMTIYQEEIFGPVVVVCRLATEEAVIRRANDTIFGLAGAVFTQDIKRGPRVARKIQAAPFGGYKQSGVGRELGEMGLDAYSCVKSIFTNLGMKLR